jgi:enoyl-CoA hydratase/carnithine racemase
MEGTMKAILELETAYATKDGPIGWIVLNRPQKLNAMNKRMQADLIACLDAFRVDADVRVLIMKGEGDRAFCAGADINDWKGTSAVERWRYDKLHARRVFEEMEAFPKPIIAQVHGHAVGGGAELLLAADIRVVAEDAAIGLTEIRFGMIPGAGGTQRLARLVGEGQAMRLVLIGEPVSGIEAARIGLAEFAVPQPELAARCERIARVIAGRSPIAIEAAKEAVKAAARNTLAGGLMHEIALSTLCFATEDKEEAVSAFTEKRQPVFRAR